MQGTVCFTKRAMGSFLSHNRWESHSHMVFEWGGSGGEESEVGGQTLRRCFIHAYLAWTELSRFHGRVRRKSFHDSTASWLGLPWWNRCIIGGTEPETPQTKLPLNFVDLPPRSPLKPLERFFPSGYSNQTVNFSLPWSYLRTEEIAFSADL